MTKECLLNVLHQYGGVLFSEVTGYNALYSWVTMVKLKDLNCGFVNMFWTQENKHK